MITCPKCEGTKVIRLFPNYFGGKRPKTVAKGFECWFCDGSGVVPDETWDWIEMGKILKSRRVAKRLVLIKAAKTLKMDCGKLSDMETGKIKPNLEISYEMIRTLKT